MQLRDRRLAIAAAAVMAGTALSLVAAPADAAPYCGGAGKASFARVQLFADANCKGSSMIIKAADSNGDRPNFARFRNYDGRVYDVDNSRSSVAVAAGTCVRVFDGANYTGDQSNILCAGSGTGYFAFSAFDNRASSIRLCPSNSQAGCARGTPAPPPVPPPALPPAPPPAPNGFPKDVTSAPDAARYDDAARWNDGKNCTGGFTVGAQRLQAWLRANYGSATIQGYNCRRNTADKSKTSIHGVGRADDWFRSASNAQHRAHVAALSAACPPTAPPWPTRWASSTGSGIATSTASGVTLSSFASTVARTRTPTTCTSR